MQVVFPEGLRLNMSVVGRNDPDLFRFLQLYHISKEPFFCIEPWMSYPNAINSLDGMRWLAPGAVDRAVLNLQIGK